MFHEMFFRLTLNFAKEDTYFQKALESGLMLVVTLCFLATRKIYQSLTYFFKVPYKHYLTLLQTRW